MDQSNIVTSQFVRIHLEPAGIGDRIVARLIDMAIMAALAIVGYIFLLSIETEIASEELLYILAALYFVPLALYSFLSELLMNGQTLGKRVMKIQVTKLDGSRPGIDSFFMRWIFEAEVYIGYGLVAIISILVSKNHQRLGDLAAGTAVKRVPDFHHKNINLDIFNWASRNYKPCYPEAAELTIGQAEVINKTLDYYGEMDYNQTVQLAEKIQKYLNIKPRQNNPTDFLTTVFHDYQYYATEII